MDPKEAVEVLKRFRDTGQLSTILCDAIGAVLAELEHPSWGRSRALAEQVQRAEAAEARLAALVGALDEIEQRHRPLELETEMGRRPYLDAAGRQWCDACNRPMPCPEGQAIREVRARAEAGGGEHE